MAGLALFVLSALITGACFTEIDECIPGEVRCSNGAASTCSGREGSRGGVVMKWNSVPCGERACLVATGSNGQQEAFCALSAQPNPLCRGSNSLTCDGNTLAECHAGFVVNQSPCSGQCISLDDIDDYCSESPPESARCVSGSGCQFVGSSYTATSGTPPGAICSADTLTPPFSGTWRVYAYRCEAGLLVARQQCAEACVSTTACATHCADESLGP